MKHVLRSIIETPWAILPAKLEAIAAVAARWASGEKLTAEEVALVTGGRPSRQNASAGNVAVLPLFGTIVPRADMLTETSGLTSAESFTNRFRAALNDAAVSGVVIDVDSPGGAVQGVDELSAEIFKARGTKPVVAVANHLAASAAYWIATAADELVVTPSGEVGSIGVFAAHDDLSGAMEKVGVKTTLISAGKFKVEGNPFEPLGEEARAAIQLRVDEFYGMFVKAVARNRGVSVADVRDGFGEGRVVGAKEAVRLGMADRVATLDETIARIQRDQKAQQQALAQADLDFRQRRARMTSE